MSNQWEYKTVNPSETYAGIEVLTKDPEEDLNHLGGEGWELASTIQESMGRTKYMVFKRPK